MQPLTWSTVLGASGDLAFKKTYPALFGLYKNGHLPARLQVVGYARSKIELGAFKARISSKIKLEGESDRVRLEEFLNLCFYSSGLYDDSESFNNLNRYISALEGDVRGSRDRVFYMALPPSVFVPASVGLRDHVYSESGQNRLIVEKPFGKDTDSSLALGKALANKWSETEVYRIDHYLGKEMVKNLMHLRFANVFFGAIWNRQHIHNVQITFKEPFGTEGRGGYFDEFGIIRDVRLVS